MWIQPSNFCFPCSRLLNANFSYCTWEFLPLRMQCCLLGRGQERGNREHTWKAGHAMQHELAVVDTTYTKTLPGRIPCLVSDTCTSLNSPDQCKQTAEGLGGRLMASTHLLSGTGIRGRKGFSSKDNTRCLSHWALSPLQAATGSCCTCALLSRACTFPLHI